MAGWKPLSRCQSIWQLISWWMLKLFLISTSPRPVCVCVCESVCVCVSAWTNSRREKQNEKWTMLPWKGNRVHRQRRCLANDAGENVLTIDSIVTVHLFTLTEFNGWIYNNKKTKKEKKKRKKRIQKREGRFFSTHRVFLTQQRP